MPRIIEPTPAHEAFLKELQGALGNSGKDLPADQLLAVASQFIGQLIAVQDQRTMTPDKAMEIVAHGIEIGNATAIETGLGNPAGRA
jgi:hypothetical protein